ncbi:unnamed protein product [Closterium sp. Naga37s-1]|nr:unnamed protein product [Closterium sp. Naga37s-1]CAI5537191.1 unnamed protein product [Closterium sp. Naga37s-1]
MAWVGGAAAEDPLCVELPERLAILPFRKRVLLPGAIIRITCSDPSRYYCLCRVGRFVVRLVEQELWQKDKPALIGIVPVIEPPGSADSTGSGAAASGSAATSNDAANGGDGNAEGGAGGTGGTGETAGGGEGAAEGKAVVRVWGPSGPEEVTGGTAKLLLEDVKWHPRGVAARALHVAKGVERPTGRVTYAVVLQGVCRFAILSINSRGPYHVARVSQLDATPQEVDRVRGDDEVRRLGRQLLRVVEELARVMEQEKQRQVTGLRKVAAESQQASAGEMQRLADILVASVEGGLAARLAMLDAVNPRMRLQLAAAIISLHLEKLRLVQQASSGSKKKKTPSSSSKPPLLQLGPPPPSSSSSTASGGKGSGEGEGKERGAAGDGEEGDEEEEEEDDDDDDDVAVLERRMKEVKMPPNVWRHVRRELKRLRKMQPQQPGYSTTRQYLELLSDLPWGISSPVTAAGAGGGGAGGSSSGALIDVAAAREQLDREHFGLERVKQRILEYIAVRKLKPDATGPVLCFVGPPGVGKTSLVSSIAKALGRKFVRIALGGVKDEADIRGHRRTYVGSMPGRLIEGVKRVAVNNPVMLLDEIDKTGADARGDPAAALLEVLDPEQNKCFQDHYLGVPFDLSRVVFVATANRAAPIPAALLDRMEVIELPGYTPEEKQRIATRHLIPRVLEQHGITKRHLHISDHAVELLITRYTREAGVRNLSRLLAALARHAAVQVAQSNRCIRIAREVSGTTGTASTSGSAPAGAPISAATINTADPLAAAAAVGDAKAELEMEVEAIGMEGKEVAAVMADSDPIEVTEEMLEKVLGPPKFDGREAAERVATPGVAVGLVWTAVGGEVQFVEATDMVGKGELHLTGQLGDVIKESAQIALTWVRARAAELFPPPPTSTPPSSSSPPFTPSDHPFDDTTPAPDHLPPLGPYGAVSSSPASPPTVVPTIHPSSFAPPAVSATPAVAAAGTYATAASRSAAPSAAAAVVAASPSAAADASAYASMAYPSTAAITNGKSSSSSIRRGSNIASSAGPVPLPRNLMEGRDIHIHFPAGAVPKDGPSAGVTLVTALVSLLSNRCVRSDTAMTGELTLRGLVLPVGGVKEKILAAHRCGIRRVILPEKNIKDLQEVPAAVLACMEVG